MATNIKAGIFLQSGNGIPNHIAIRGTVFIDKDEPSEYISNGDGTWVVGNDFNLTANQYAAITGSSSPSSSNVFATMSDLVAISGDTKEVKVSNSDTTPGFLSQKIIDSTNISASIVNSGGNEKIILEPIGLATLTGATFTGPITATTINAITLSGNYLTINDVTINKILLEKAGVVNGTGFTGNPKKAIIVFSSNFPNTSYTTIITGMASRVYTCESITISGFTINSNANTSFAENIYWIAKQIGEV